MSVQTIHPNSALARMSTDHLVDVIHGYISDSRFNSDRQSARSTSRALQLLLLELDDREEWRIGTALRRQIHEVKYLKVF